MGDEDYIDNCEYCHEYGMSREAMEKMAVEFGCCLILKSDLEWLYSREKGSLKYAYLDGPRKQRIEEALKGG